ncbi:MAG: hypothetical protein IPM25_03790 [Chloracidobacterium sp.]|nr:hypothetical protein [Chloracidobacterium sp.]
MKILILSAIFIFLFSTFLSSDVMAQTLTDSKVEARSFQAGQVWSYKARQGESNSTFVVLKVDTDERSGNIVHIAVMDVKMKNRRSPDGFSRTIGHMPFSEKSLAQSAIKLLKENVELPEFEVGYRLWREAFDDKRAGYYTVSLAEAVNITEESLNF